MAMGATIVIAAGWSLYQFVATGSPRVGGFNGLNQLPYAMAILLWSLVLLARAFASKRFDAIRAVVAVVGLAPIFLSGSKLVWLATGLGYTAILLWWAWSWRQWILLGVFALVAGGVALALYQTRVVQGRVAQLVAELSAFAATGDTSGATFGLRLSAAASGFLAFLERPLFGYGLADVKLAALTHRPDYVTDFTHLWHLHNQYITHMVAFGIFGLLFLVGLLAMFPFSGSRGGDEGVKRFSYVAPGLVAMYMLAAKLFSGSPLYGVVFVLLGIVLFANTETEISPARST
jgi:O-antigen ligase